jgi:Flp pilus assembly CpaE family ATPase
MLVDADVYGGILASAFGLLDESPGMAGACRLAANGRLDTADLASLCWSVGDDFALLTGIARADRWPEVRPSAVPSVLRMARQLAELVVVDCSAVLETDEEISFDTMAPRRNGATLAVLDEADTVLAVGSADPPGMERLVRGLDELRAAVDGPAPQVVLNRVRRTAAPPGDLAATVRRFAGTDPIALLPEDRAACDRAWQRGVTLSAAAPKSTLVARLGELAHAVMPVSTGAAGGGRPAPAVSP